MAGFVNSLLEAKFTNPALGDWDTFTRLSIIDNLVGTKY
jgi:hypothetical protein